MLRLVPFAVLLALVLAVPGAAAASCDASNLYSYTFNTATAANLAYTGSYTYTARNSLGATVNFTISFTTNGLTTSVVDGVTLPAISNIINDAGTNNNLVVGGQFGGRTASITGGTRVIQTTFTFATTVRDVSIQLNDVDYGADQFRDWIYASGTSAAGTYVPGLTTPYTNNNGSGPRSDATSVITFGAATTPFAISSNEAVGTGVNPNTDATLGTMYVGFAQPVTAAKIIYGNYPLQSGETVTGVQAMGIETISFCPMPAIAVTKTSAPVDDPIDGTTNPKLIPGADVDYTLTVANTGGSAVDLATVVLTDTLPANVSFDNGDIDPATAGTQNYVFTANASGTTLAAANITFSNNGGSSYAYTPAAGYDPAVNAIRFAPQGTMAANSSFSIRFRALVK